MLTLPPQHRLLCQNLLWSTISTRCQEAELLSGEYMGGAALLGHPSVKSCTRTSSLITICSTWCAGESCWFSQVAHPVGDRFLKVSSQSVSISQREVIQVTSAGLKISHIHYLCFWKTPFLTAVIPYDERGRTPPCSWGGYLCLLTGTARSGYIRDILITQRIKTSTIWNSKYPIYKKSYLLCSALIT